MVTQEEMFADISDWLHGMLERRFAAGDPVAIALVEQAEREQSAMERRAS